MILSNQFSIEPDNMIPESLLHKFQSFIREHNLIKADDKILLAVSGGLDSTVMCELFFHSAYNFGIAHCNFQLRENESELDELFVSELAAKYGVEFFVKKFDTHNYKLQNKLSLEEAARNMRYEWFEEMRQSFNYNAIATAHHLNDSIETIFLNLIKGTGIAGLKGIQSKNKNVIRPLLFATKSEIEAYANEKNISYRIDQSNLKNEFQRNKIRNEIIPLLKELNPSLEKTFEKNIRHFNEAGIIYKSHVEQKLKKLIHARGNEIYVPIASLNNIAAKATYLFELLKPFGYHEDQIIEISENMHGSGKNFYSDTHRVIIDRRFLIITKKNTAESGHIIIYGDMKSVHAPGFRLKIDISDYKNIKINKSGFVGYFDFDKIEFPLVLRKWKKGDYFYPLGLYKKSDDSENQLKPAKKKLSDVFTDLKIDLHTKENTWVLLSGEKIIWVVGLRQDERFKITSKTKKIYKITVKNDKPSHDYY